MRERRAMIVEAGHFALILALALALAQTAIPFWGARSGDRALMGVGVSAAIGQFAFVAMAFAALAAAHLDSDFSVLNVAENSHSQMPTIYKFSGIWGNHEGSMLLWSLILATFGALVAVTGRALPERLRADALSVQGLISAAFLAFILATSNPFARLVAGAVRGQRSQSDPAGPGPRDPSADALHGLCRILDRVLVRRRGADRGPDRRRLGAFRAPVRADRLVLPHRRHRDGLVLGLLHAGLGRVLVLGPGRERILDAVARRHGLPALGRGDGKARRAEDLDDLPRHPRIFLFAAGHVSGALRRAHLGPRLRQRSAARRSHPGDPRLLHRGLAQSVRVARADAETRRPVRADLARGRAGAQQPVADHGPRDRVVRHALSARAGAIHRRKDLGRRAVLQHDRRSVAARAHFPDAVRLLARLETRRSPGRRPTPRGRVRRRSRRIRGSARGLSRRPGARAGRGGARHLRHAGHAHRGFRAHSARRREPVRRAFPRARDAAVLLGRRDCAFRSGHASARPRRDRIRRGDDRLDAYRRAADGRPV